MTATFSVDASILNLNADVVTRSDIAKLADGRFVAVFSHWNSSGAPDFTHEHYMQFLDADGAANGAPIDLSLYFPLTGDEFTNGAQLNVEALDSGLFAINFMVSDFETSAVNPVYENKVLVFAPDGTLINTTAPSEDKNVFDVDMVATADGGFAILNISADGAVQIDKHSAFGGLQKSFSLLDTADPFSAIDTVAVNNDTIAVVRSTSGPDEVLTLDFVNTTYYDPFFPTVFSVPNTEEILDISLQVLDSGDIFIVYYKESGAYTRIFDVQTNSFGAETLFHATPYTAGQPYVPSFFSEIETTRLDDGTILVRFAADTRYTSLDEHFVQKFNSSNGNAIDGPITVVRDGFSNAPLGSIQDSTIIGTDDGGFLIVGAGISTDPTNYNQFQIQTFWQGTSGNDVEYMLKAGLFEARDGFDFVEGSDGDDIIFGGNGSDVLRGGDGNDFIHAQELAEYSYSFDFESMDGGAGNDTLISDGGNTIAKGGPGDDLIITASGSDIIEGGDGNDVIKAGFGNDDIDGGLDNDLIKAGGGDDTVVGNKGRDILRGGEGSDFIEGNAGFDRLYGGQGNDILNGGNGKDNIRGGDGDDLLTGGLGEDKFIFLEDGSAASYANDNLVEEDIITDFTIGEDIICIKEATGVATFADLEIEYEGGAAVILYGNREITVQGIETALIAGDFDFA